MPPKRRSEQLKRARCSIGGASVQVTRGDDDDDDSDDDDDIDEQDLFHGNEVVGLGCHQ